MRVCMCARVAARVQALYAFVVRERERERERESENWLGWPIMAIWLMRMAIELAVAKYGYG